MKIFFFCGLLCFLGSCGGDHKPEEGIGVDTGKAKEEGMSFEDRVKRHVEADLQILPTEKYSMKIYKEHLNEDNKEDAIITVNRLEHALLEAEKSGKSAKMAEIGFFGNHNFIFYYDGALDKITPYIPMMSCPEAELKISFVNLMSDAYKDVVVDFRIRGSQFRDYITVKNHNPKVIFEWNVFENLGKPNASAIYFDIVEKEVGLSKEIVMYQGILENNTSGQIPYDFVPKIKKTNKKIYTWFYDQVQGKYCTVDANK